MILTLDFETRSPVDLRTRGAWVYARHPGTKVLFTGVAVDNAPAITIPARELKPLIEKADIVVAHNAVFEWLIARYVLKINIPVEKLHCTLAMAAAMGLPLNLDTLAEAMGLPGKDKEGYAAMLKECKPRRPRKGEDPNGTYYYDSPYYFGKIERYCRGDVSTERTLFHKLKRLSNTERKIWLMDFTINRRGIPLDCPSIRLLRDRVERRKEEQLVRFREITKGAVESPQCYLELAQWVSKELGQPVPSVAKAAVTELLEQEIPSDVREVLEIKAELSKSSVAKFDAMLNRQVGGRLQGAHQYYGAATGRWAGRGIQPQNLPKDSYGEEDYERILAYLDKEDLRFFYGDPFYFASKCIRGSIATAQNPERLFFCADFSSIESRGLAYLAGENWVLDAYRAGMDLYKLFAAQALGKRYEEITSKERQVPGKVGVLACVAEGSLVLTDTGLVPIEKVNLAMRVWDGVDWVKHEGAIYQGEKEVMDYDGLQATPDHVVYTEERGQVSLQKAAREKQRLVQTGSGRTPLRYGAHHKPPHQNRKRTKKSLLSMLQLLSGKMDKSRESIVWENWRLPKMQPTFDNPKMVTKTIRRRETPMSKSRSSSVQKLWGERYRVPFCFSDRCGSLDYRKLRARTNETDRSDRQRRALRTRKSEMGHLFTEQKQYSDFGKYGKISQIQTITSRCKILGQYFKKFIKQGFILFTDRKKIPPKELQTKRRVWDILNAGPRNRFTVSGKLVHNCGYQGGPGACRRFGVDGTDDYLYATIVDPWREANPKAVQFWYEMESAVIQAIRWPGKIFTVGFIKVVVQNDFLLIRLPSGRCIHYYRPSLAESDKFSGKMEIRYWGNKVVDGKTTAQWARVGTYGGKLVENCLSGDTEILTPGGWIRLDEYREGTLIWDGVGFVYGGKLLDKGYKEVITYNSVDLTLNHKVLCDEGWRTVHEITSQCGRFNRKTVCLPTSDFLSRLSKRAFTMGGRMCVREKIRSMGKRANSFTRSFSEILWLYDQKNTKRKTKDPRKIEASFICNMEIHERSMPFTNSSSISQLWGQRNKSGRTLANVFRKFLSRYGINLSERVNFRSKKQQRRILSQKLSLGIYDAPSTKQTRKCVRRFPLGIYDYRRGIHEIWDWTDYVIQSGKKRMAERTPFFATEFKQLQIKKVYDIADCGPRHRFVVKKGSGEPMIVHNCTQAFCRDLLASAMLRLEAAGFPIVMHVHDEVICEVNKNADFDGFLAIMKEVPAWAPGLPLDVTGWKGRRYRKE